MIAAMTAFLSQQTDRFVCSAIPRDARLGTEDLYQGAWRYLIVVVGTAWRVLGISWSGMGPLFGVLFAATIAAAYGIFRLGMGRSIAPLLSPLLTWQMKPRLGFSSDILQPAVRVADLHMPLLVIGGDADQHATLAETRLIYANANAPKELWVIPGARHQDFQPLGVLEPDGTLPEAISPAVFAGRIKDELGQWKQIATEHKIVAE